MIYISEYITRAGKLEGEKILAQVSLIYGEMHKPHVGRGLCSRRFWSVSADTQI